jgi:hypothetical protein
MASALRPRGIPATAGESYALIKELRNEPEGETVVRKPAWSIAFLCLALLVPLKAHAQQAKPQATVGAYYFDGWNGATSQQHITKLLQTEFADRKPVWGWTADTVEIMRKQMGEGPDAAGENVGLVS